MAYNAITVDEDENDKVIPEQERELEPDNEEVEDEDN